MGEAALKRDTIAARRRAQAGDVRARRRQEIVDAAVRAIEELGCDAGLGAVADRAGLPRPHVYRHFTGKDDLDEEVARHAGRLLSAWIRPSLTARGTPPEVIRGVIGRVLRWAVDHPHLYRFRVRLGPAQAVPELADAAVAYLRAAGYDARPPDHVVASVIGMVDAGVIWWLDHREGAGLDSLNEWLAAQVWLVLADMLERIGRPLDPYAELAPALDRLS
ncbi:TetR/AcrR family transcriptional regulator [Couchioplanes azureus]|uniref:TetR/AcrR family transcriptional regulator n=1 Tax=Couchioplanes caeruleus TaxID=56438 RepID=UPI0016701723|nr:TetR/AcrR family transcriptional regulator [Couchioplanes caeruleus]GGQ39370.1 putative TetR-family transcriptional regulator [Couchioplanes caeruleus subsp. azureus]